jgi:hypothetical protein
MHRQGTRHGDIMLNVLVNRLLRLAMFGMALMYSFCMPKAAVAQQHRAIDLFHAKDQVDYVEVLHIAHVDTVYRSAILLGDLSSRGLDAQDYVRIRARNFRAINDLYKALNNTAIGPNTRCDGGYPLDVRWAIVVNYVNHTKEAVGLDPLQNCIQILSIPAPFRSSPDLVRYVQRTFPFMK